MSRQFPALRGLAILLVVLNHAITLSMQSARQYGFPTPAGFEHVLWIGLLTTGLIAVPTFYFLSGGFLVFAVRGKSLAQAYKTVFLSLRHIIFPYLIWSAAFYVLIFFIQDETYSLGGYLRNLLIGYPLNFVPLLMFFYLLAPVLIRLIARLPWVTLLLVASYQVFSVVVLRPALVGATVPGWLEYFTIPGVRLSVAIWGIFFPLGLTSSLHSDRMHDFLHRWRWVVAALAGVSFGLAVMHELNTVSLPLVGLILPVFVVLLYPLIERGRIPAVRQLESLGRRAYGLYLTNLIWLSLALIFIRRYVPWLMENWIMLVPVLILWTIGILSALMWVLERMKASSLRRYLFG